MRICLKLTVLILLAAQSGLGQQNPQTTLESLLATAKQAQARSDYAAAANAYKQAVAIRPEVPELWANLGLMEHETGNYADAIRSFQQARRLKPQLYVPTLFLGVDYARTGKAKEAVPLLLAAEKMNATDSQPYLALGRAYASLQEYGAAAQAFAHVTRSDPAQSQAWFSLGMAYLHQVEADARTMTGKGQNSPYAKALFAGSLANQSRYIEAADLYKSVLSSSEQPPCIRGELGFVYLKQRDVSGAAQQFSAESEPVCSLALLGQARLRVDAGSNEEGLKLLAQLWDRDPGFLQANVSAFAEGMAQDRGSSFASFLTRQHGSHELPDGLYGLLTANLRSQSAQMQAVPTRVRATSPSLAAAEKDYASGRYKRCADRTANSLATKNQSGLRLLAACSSLTGDEELSSRASGELRALAPQSMEALYWSIKSNERLAFQALERYEQLEPNSERTHLLLGDIFVQRERYGDARAEYQKALALSPGDPAALAGLASAALRDGNVDQAFEAAQKALERAPEDPEINLLMAEALVERHELPDAEPFLKKGLNAKPQMLPHVHALLGRVYAATSRPQEAISELKIGLESDDDGSVHYQLARLYRQAGDDRNAAIAMEQMKAIQQRRREGAVTALKDSHPSSLDDEP
ncbi:tetratricopeptide repeat protein [Edaphobacter bradus]|uniref:tetratricopeptide repeat protein n=1 Tax=Edaphobacter bradus TaxID=2259016 RepID=UPI0021DFFCDD|nr:tetratricopeptide repeat protein [Edaphobacter bradus]